MSGGYRAPRDDQGRRVGEDRMTDALRAALERIAPALGGLRASPRATPSYDIMSDALIWSDELPERGMRRYGRDLLALRFVFAHRTRLILDLAWPDRAEGEGEDLLAETC